jgi:hypothetical protein
LLSRAEQNRQTTLTAASIQVKAHADRART